jgi:DNA-binding transcriptional MerR regulator
MPIMALQELEERSGIPARTIRYYIARQILDPPVVAGRNAGYSETHLQRLLDIKKYQQEGLTLDQIKDGMKPPDSNIMPSINFLQVIPGSERYCWTEGQVHPQIKVLIRNDLLQWHKGLLDRVEQAIVEILKKEGVCNAFLQDRNNESYPR